MTNGSKLVFGVDVSPLSLARMIWKRKLTVALVWLGLSAASLALIRTLPATYRASALIILDSQKIPEKFVSATVNSDVQDRFAAISQQILSSSQLKKIIDQFNLYRKERAARFPEEILEMMRADISITPERAVAGRGHGAFRIGYQGPDPVVIAQVVNQIANLYIEENLKIREVQAEGTSEFIEAQLNEAKQRLDELESAVSAFKVRHNGELPQQEGSLNATLTRLSAELGANRDALNRAHASKVTLESALSAAEESLAMQQRAIHTASKLVEVPVEPIPATEPAATPKPKSEVLREQLAVLRLRYSEEHPDLQRLRRELERVEAQERHAPASDLPTAGARRPENPRPVQTAPRGETAELRQTRERMASLKSQISQIERAMEADRAEQRRILSEMTAYQSRVARLPIREQEMAQITRDYEIAKMNYRSLLDKKISADMAADMERRQKAERFTLADPARVPGKPFRPNRRMLGAAGSGIGLALGLALALVLEARLGVLLGEWQLPAGVIVLGRVPEIRHSSLAQEGSSIRGAARWLKFPLPLRRRIF
jgi:polysaccharide chain length determinant protein (PEP-CTERM system associated)